MMSDDLLNLADRLSGYALRGRALEPEVAGSLAGVLADLSRQVRTLEDRPFIVTPEPRATTVFHARRRNG